MNRAKWTNDEISIMCSMRGQGYTHKEIAEKLNRTTASISKKLSLLGLTCKMDKVLYSEEENNTLIRLREEGYTYSEISSILGRTKSSVIAKSKRLGITKKHNCWSSEQEEYLKDLISQNKTIQEISIIMGKSISNCKKKIDSLELDFNNSATIYLIYIKDLELYKIGITTNDLETRMKAFPFTYKLVEKVLLEKEDARSIEKLIIEKYCGDSIKYKCEGYTEMFYSSSDSVTIKELLKNIA